MGVTLGTVCLAVYLYIVVPKGFFPQQDTGRLNGNARASEDISFQAMKQKLAQYVEIVQSDPAVEVVTGFVGGRVNTANLNITLKPLSERKISADKVINRLRPKMARVPGADAVFAGRAGRDHRRARRQRAIPVHAAGGQPRGYSPLRAACRTEIARGSATAGREHRPAG